MLKGAPCPWRAVPCARGCRSKQGVRAQAAATASALMLKVGSCSLPHPDKVATGGEDAFFVSSDNRAIGVADGVGGWRESGIDPGDYSRTLMRVACEFFEARVGQPAPADTKDAEDVARNAIAAAHQKTHMPGSSTVCILTLNADDKFVSAANLGDSGFAVVRNGTVVFQTPALQHFFDCPYQLGSYPDFVDATDYPSDASTFSLNVMPGDVIVMGSDGLWDNLPMQEIVQLLPDTDDAIDASAEVLATVAREHADDDEFESPYVQSARDEGLDLPWWRKVLQAKIDDGKLQLGRLTGGKLDDITVLVARVADAPEAAPEAEAEATAVVGQGADVRTPQFDGSTADESIKQNESDGDTRPA